MKTAVYLISSIQMFAAKRLKAGVFNHFKVGLYVTFQSRGM